MHVCISTHQLLLLILLSLISFVLHLNNLIVGNKVDLVLVCGADHLISDETDEGRQRCPPGAETKAGQRLLQTSFSRYGDRSNVLSLVMVSISSIFFSRRQRAIRGKRTARPDLCQEDSRIPSKAISKTKFGRKDRSGRSVPGYCAG